MAISAVRTRKYILTSLILLACYANNVFAQQPESKATQWTTIKGIITDENKIPLTNATVQFIQNGHIVYITYTDWKGYYYFYTRSRGIIDLTVNCDCGTPWVFKNIGNSEHDELTKNIIINTGIPANILDASINCYHTIFRKSRSHGTIYTSEQISHMPSNGIFD